MLPDRETLLRSGHRLYYFGLLLESDPHQSLGTDEGCECDPKTGTGISAESAVGASSNASGLKGDTSPSSGRPCANLGGGQCP